MSVRPIRPCVCHGLKTLITRQRSEVTEATASVKFDIPGRLGRVPNDRIKISSHTANDGSGRQRVRRKSCLVEKH